MQVGMSSCGWLILRFFFFQAEDGIRDLTVTGVQTCALPICQRGSMMRPYGRVCVSWRRSAAGSGIAVWAICWRARGRSEERRVGKSVDLGGRRIIKKKKKIVKRVVEKMRSKDGMRCARLRLG